MKVITSVLKQRTVAPNRNENFAKRWFNLAAGWNVYPARQNDNWALPNCTAYCFGRSLEILGMSTNWRQLKLVWATGSDGADWFQSNKKAFEAGNGYGYIDFSNQKLVENGRVVDYSNLSVEEWRKVLIYKIKAGSILCFSPLNHVAFIEQVEANIVYDQPVCELLITESRYGAYDPTAAQPTGTIAVTAEWRRRKLNLISFLNSGNSDGTIILPNSTKQLNKKSNFPFYLYER